MIDHVKRVQQLCRIKVVTRFNEFVSASLVSPVCRPIACHSVVEIHTQTVLSLALSSSHSNKLGFVHLISVSAT
jgi:hypothetical protein